MKSFFKPRLLCPGPTPVLAEARAQALDTDIYHRTPEFFELFLNCRKRIAPILGSANLPIILTASGTGAMEAALVNLTNEGDEVITIAGGKFGDRWSKLARAYACKTHEFQIKWGSAPSPDAVAAFAKSLGKPKAIFFQANETSTATYFPVREIARALRSNATTEKILIVVDCISSLLAHEIRMDDWGIDAVVAGSQKGFGIPPGLSFIALSNRAVNALSERPCFYFDLRREAKGQDKGESAWTPATHLIQMLDASLKEIEALGLDRIVKLHAAMAKACRSAVQAIGLELLTSEHPSNAVTAIKLPESIDASKLMTTLERSYGSILAGGQDHLKGKIIRLAHLGVVDPFHLLNGITALEFALKDIGYLETVGAGTAKAADVLHSELP